MFCLHRREIWDALLPCLLAGFDCYSKKENSSKDDLEICTRAATPAFCAFLVSFWQYRNTVRNSSSAGHIYMNKPTLSSATDALCVAFFNYLFAVPTYAVVCALEEVVDVQQEGPAVGGAALLGEEGQAAGHLGLGVVTQQGHEGNAEGDDEGQGYSQPDVPVLNREL
jgi:hypothetical protein